MYHNLFYGYLAASIEYESPVIADKLAQGWRLWIEKEMWAVAGISYTYRDLEFVSPEMLLNSTLYLCDPILVQNAEDTAVVIELLSVPATYTEFRKNVMCVGYLPDTPGNLSTNQQIIYRTLQRIKIGEGV